MKASSATDKYKYYLNKRLQIFLNSFDRSQLQGRKTGPKVVLNALPKSGTHLLENVFFKLPYMRHSGRRTLFIEIQNPLEKKLRVLGKIRKGQFQLAHMQYHSKVLEVLKKNDLKMIQLVRDPRDVLISHLNYIQNIDKTQKSHRYISNYNTTEDKIKAMINGKPNVIEPFPKVLNKFEPWLDKKNILTVKFEDLIGDKGGGKTEKQILNVKSIAQFCEIKVADARIIEISGKIYSKKSSTFNKGKIGNWKNVLDSKTQDHVNQNLKKYIFSYGYDL